MKINNEIDKTLAPSYDDSFAPGITTKEEEEGDIAKQIIATAKEHGIPLEQNNELTSLLCKVSFNEEIPKQLYIAVAQVLTFLYYVDKRK